MAESYYGAKKKEKPNPPRVIEIPKGKVLNFGNYLFKSNVLEVNEVSHLEKNTCGNLYIGTAFDGLPLLLNINRSHSVKHKVLSSLGVGSEDSLPNTIRSPLDALEKAIGEKSCQAGIFTTDSLGDKAKQYYKTSNGMGQLLQKTAFSQLTGDTAVSSLNERGEDYEFHAQYKRTTMNMGIAIKGKLRSDEPLAVKTDTQTGKTTLEPLFVENLTNVFPNLQFSCQSTSSDWKHPTVYEGKVKDRKSYFSALNDASNVNFLISRKDLAQVVVKVAREVHKTMHEKGMVHGDVKPSNILFLSEGVKLIDSRGCKKGSICATFTENWAPPEQILGKPVDFSADVYSLGMLASKVVDGEVYGEIRQFKVPGQKSAIQILDTEGVWLDNSSKLSEKARQAWRSALTSFLSYDTKKRPVDGKEFADQLEKLISEHPLDDLPGIQMDAKIGTASLHKVTKQTISKYFKEYSEIKDIEKLEYVPCWVLEDSYSSIV